MRDSLLVTLIGACGVCLAIGCDGTDAGSMSSDVPSANTEGYATTPVGGADDPNGRVTDPVVDIPDTPGPDEPEPDSDEP